MIARVAIVCLAAHALGAPCTDESCDNSDSHLLQVSGKSATLEVKDELWSQAPSIRDACAGVYDGAETSTSLLNRRGDDGVSRLSDALKSFWAPTRSTAPDEWNPTSCAGDDDNGPYLNPSTRCTGTSFDLVQNCINSFLAFIHANEDGIQDSAKLDAWHAIGNDCSGPMWDSGHWQVQMSTGGTKPQEGVDAALRAGKCQKAMEKSGYFTATGGWGEDIVEFWTINKDLTADKHSHVFSYPQSDLDGFRSSPHTINDLDSWADLNPKFCGGQMSGNVAHRCLRSGEHSGGDEIALDGNEFTHVTMQNCLDESFACTNCIHMGGVLNNGMNGLPAQSVMWFQISPGTPDDTTTVGKCCFFSEPCDETYQEGPRHRQNIIVAGHQTAELGRAAFNVHRN